VAPTTQTALGVHGATMTGNTTGHGTDEEAMMDIEIECQITGMVPDVETETTVKVVSILQDRGPRRGDTIGESKALDRGMDVIHEKDPRIAATLKNEDGLSTEDVVYR